jgi:ribonuclease-3 family protein
MEKKLEFLSYVKEMFDIPGFDVQTYSPLELAYIGDAVYEVVIRTIVVTKHNTQVNKLHKMSSSLVKASSQAKMITLILEELTTEELSVYKRGRNAKSFTMAKNATVSDYRMATGFEALIGYLYLSGQSERMMQLIKSGLTAMEMEKERG